MQNENMREKIAEQMTRSTIKGARADLHIQVKDGASSLEGDGNNIGLLLAMSVIGTTFVKIGMEGGHDLEFCKGALQAAINQAVADATERAAEQKS